MRDILPRLKSRASHPVLAGQVNPDGWGFKVCDRRRWLCHEAVTRTPRGASRYLVLCRSARPAYFLISATHRGKHRINCQLCTSTDEELTIRPEDVGEPGATTFGEPSATEAEDDS